MNTSVKTPFQSALERAREEKKHKQKSQEEERRRIEEAKAKKKEKSRELLRRANFALELVLIANPDFKSFLIDSATTQSNYVQSFKYDPMHTGIVIFDAGEEIRIVIKISKPDELLRIARTMKRPCPEPTIEFVVTKLRHDSVYGFTLYDEDDFSEKVAHELERFSLNPEEILHCAARAVV